MKFTNIKQHGSQSITLWQNHDTRCEVTTMSAPPGKFTQIENLAWMRALAEQLDAAITDEARLLNETGTSKTTLASALQTSRQSVARRLK